MDTACGTLSYVAPEVLTMTVFPLPIPTPLSLSRQGYGQEADLWSVGVILFLVLCGKLPFDGATHDEIIRNTVQGDFRVSSSVWGKLSPDAQNLIRALLQKNPKSAIFCFSFDSISQPFSSSLGIALPLVLL
jgi:serine/threonine protein kinase